MIVLQWVGKMTKNIKLSKIQQVLINLCVDWANNWLIVSAPVLMGCYTTTSIAQTPPEKKYTLIPTSLAAKAQRAYWAHFTDLHNSRVKILLPGKQNDDLWNGWCVLLSPPSRVFCSPLTTAAELITSTFISAHPVFHTSLSHSRLPPSSHIYIHAPTSHKLHTSAISVTMETRAPQLPGRALFFEPSFVSLQRWSQTGGVSVWPLNQHCVFQGCVCVCVCVIGLATGLETGMPDRM